VLVLGSVPYANARPLLEGLAGDPGVRLLLEAPARLSARLEAGEVDAALVPSVAVLRDPSLVPIHEGCIASRGAVASVSLFCRRPLRAGARILMDESSLSSAALARVLLAGPLGVADPDLGPCPPSTDPRTAAADAVLLIGDPALVQDRRGLEEVDLGGAWTRWTGLPMVWALWAARDGAAAAAAAPRLREARLRGRDRLPEVVRREAARLRIPEASMARYLTHHIRHEFGEEERRGLERFREECARAGLLGGRAAPAGAGEPAAAS
jgi:chorismate dehydratase